MKNVATDPNYSTANPNGAAVVGSPAGGDLSGTLPNPSVIAIGGVAITGTPAAGDEIIATSSTAAHWATPPASLSNPMTAVGDIIVGGTVSGGVAAPARLGIGGANTLLHGGTTPAYSAVVPADLDVSVDNTTANATTGHHGLLPKLGGGTTNFLRADGSWASPGGGSSPLTTKGDVWGYSTTDARIPIGSDGQVLTADSTQTLGLKWAAGGGGGNAFNENDAAVLVNATSTGDAGNRADHFPGTSLGGAWTNEATALTASAVKYSSLGMRQVANAASHMLQAYTPSGAFRIEERLQYRFATNGGCGAFVRDSGSGDSTGDGVLAWLSSTGSLAVYALNGGSYSAQGGSPPEGGMDNGYLYLAIERNGSNTWTVQYSLDRALWVNMATPFSKTFTVAKAGYRLFGGGNAVQVATDFFDVVL